MEVTLVNMIYVGFDPSNPSAFLCGFQWIGLKENLQKTSDFFPSKMDKYGDFLKFPQKPIEL